LWLLSYHYPAKNHEHYSFQRLRVFNEVLGTLPG
jgi:hypothetical protein